MTKKRTPATGSAVAGAKDSLRDYSYARIATPNQDTPPFKGWRVTADLLVEVLA